MLLENYIKKWKRKKPFDKVSDFLFIILLIALLIPASRTSIIVSVKRIAAFSPRSIASDERETVLPDDFYWKLEDLNGFEMNMVDFRGKTIFINEWATWCPPCIAEMPSLQKLYDQLNDEEDIAFLLITNEKKDVVEKFISDNGYTFPVMMARSNTPDSFYSPSIPATFLVSPAGEIVLKEIGSKKWHGENTVNLIRSLGDSNGR